MSQMTPTHRAAYAHAMGRVLALTVEQLKRLADKTETPERARDRMLRDCETVPCAVLTVLEAA